MIAKLTSRLSGPVEDQVPLNETTIKVKQMAIRLNEAAHFLVGNAHGKERKRGELDVYSTGEKYFDIKKPVNTLDLT